MIGRFFRRFYLAVILVFMYLPIASLIVFSFNESKSPAVWSGFSLKWYAELFRDPAIGEALWVTVSIAVLAAAASAFIGTLAAIGIDSLRQRARDVVINLTYIPLVNLCVSILLNMSVWSA